MTRPPPRQRCWPTRLAVLALAIAAGPTAVPAAGSRDGGLESDLAVEGMTFVGTRDDRTEFVVQAEHAVYDPTSRVARLREVHVRSTEGGPMGEEFTIRCDRGELDTGTSDFLADGNVEGVLADGRQYAAPWVRYDHEQSLLFSDAPVVLHDTTGVYRGDGFRYYVAEQRFKLLGNVSLVQAP